MHISYTEWRENILDYVKYTDGATSDKCLDCRDTLDVYTDDTDSTDCDVCNGSGMHVYDEHGHEIKLTKVAYKSQIDRDKIIWNKYLESKNKHTPKSEKD